MCQGPAEIETRVVELESQENPGYGKSREVEPGSLERTQDMSSREMELGSQENPGYVKQEDGAGLSREPRICQEQSREVELGSRENPGYHKRMVVELGSHSRMAFVAAKLFLNSCFSDIVFVTLLCTAVKTAISEVHKLPGTGGVPISLTSLFWRWLSALSVFAGRTARTSY